jgi:hypothetical protein
MPGRLNSFQRTMLDWNDLHPYNAIHAVRLRTRLDPKLVRNAIQKTLERRGISALEIDRPRKSFSYFNEPAPCDFTVLPEISRTALLSEIERQINLPFPWQQRFCPFRFFAAPDTDGLTLGLVYFHPVADAMSVVHLLREIVDLIVGAMPNGRAPELYPAPRDGMLRQPGLLWQKLCALPAQSRNVRRSCRPLYHNRRDLAIGFDLFSLPATSLRTALVASKAWNVTLNDLFLAALIKELAPFGKERIAGSRQNISIGCIVNLRRELGLEGREIFGLFLGSFLVSHSAIGELALPSLARDVRRQTQFIKEQRLFLATPVDLALARWTQRFFSLERRSKFYQKNHPLWGGITNMNLNAIWGKDGQPQPLDYFRAVSTGPATPLVFSITTAGDAASVGVSYRRTVFSAEQIGQIKTGFLASFTDLEAAR